jgi:hypothetical protein
MLVSVAVAHNEAEAEMIRGRLAAEGITASYKRSIGSDLPQLGAAGGHDISVDERDAARARELLAAPAFSDEELAQLSEQSAPPDD